MSVRGLYSKFPVWTSACRVLMVLALLALAAVSPAQEPSRRVIARAAPTYPDLAKKMHLSGKVKIEVEISPAGSVTSARMIGGNPVFETAALAAVKQWKFESAQAATKCIIPLEFSER